MTDFLEAAAAFLLSWEFVSALWIGVLLGAWTWTQRVCLRQREALLAAGWTRRLARLKEREQALGALEHVQRNVVLTEVRVRFECPECGEVEARAAGVMCEACRAVLGMTGIQKQRVFDEIRKQVEGDR